MYFFDRQNRLAENPLLFFPDKPPMTYREVWDLGDSILQDMPDRSLIFLLCKNEAVPISAYLGCLRKGCVPLLLSADITSEHLNELIRIYSPAGILLPAEQASSVSFSSVSTVYTGSSFFTSSGISWTDGTWSLLFTSLSSPSLHPDLALLLSTSGSTGSPKLVRLSCKNLQSNAESIASYLQITDQDRPVTSLPMSYTYGLSVINSHLLKGASLAVTELGLLDVSFWDFCRNVNATSLAGVPSSYAILDRIGFRDMNLPSLTVLTQAGGRLPEDLQEEFARYAEEHGIRFYIMYGQTEATARMSYLSPEWCKKKPGSIGKPIPGGAFQIDNGELIYKGPNVSMGYAESAEDLKKGDENNGILHTGDLARADEDGFYYIVGRKKRFVKVSGRRVSLDDLEKFLAGYDPSCTFLCAGKDDDIHIGIVRDPLPNPEAASRQTENILTFLNRQTGIRYSIFHIHYLNEVPRTTSGKTDYNRLMTEA